MIDDKRMLLTEEVPGGAMWSHVLRRHQVLRLTDVEGGGNVSMLLYNRDLPVERYNMADTLKAQHTALLTKGFVLYSDMGRILCSITEDTCGWHDTLTGLSDAASVEAKYGRKSYQEHRNAFVRSGRDEMLTELAKWGLCERDLVPNLNLFTKVAPDVDGKLSFVAGHSQPGASVSLRAEMNVLVVMTTCPHAYETNPSYAPRKIGVEIYAGDPPGADDLCRRSRPENERGFANTERMFL
jgi:hypothetical protein